MLLKQSSPDAVVFGACMLAAVFWIGLELGHHELPALPECPVVQGERVVETFVHRDRSMTCVYVRHTRGFAKGIRKVGV